MPRRWPPNGQVPKFPGCRLLLPRTRRAMFPLALLGRNRSPLMTRLAAAFIMLISTVLGTASVFAQQRLPTIPPDQYTAEQKKAAEEFLSARKVPVFGPFEPMMH